MNKQQRTNNKQQCKKPLITRSGFSLIELLVVVTLLSTVALIVTQVFVITIRSQGKGEILKEVKQNGDYAMSVMESLIRNARSIDPSSCNTNSASVKIENQNGFTTTFQCTSGQLASVSAGFPTPTPTIYQSLTGSSVSISNCTFRIVCPTPPINPKYIFVNFTVSQSGAGSSPETRATVDYQQTISLRIYE